MKRLLIILSIVFVWTCSSPTKSEPAPQPPTVNNLSITTNEDTPTTFTMTGTDPEGAALTFSVSTQPQNGTVTASGAAGTYTPNENFNGTDTFAYIASDGALSSTAGLVSVTITAVDDDPNTMNVSAITDEDNAVEIILEAEEYDGDTISFSIKDNPTSGSVTLNGDKATYSPNENYFGSDSFTFEAVDTTAKKILNTATASITINPINDAPTIETQSVEGIQYSTLSISLGGSDVDGDNLSFIIDEDVNNGTITISGSSLEFVPDPVWHGQDSLSVKVYDGNLYSEPVKVYIDYNYIYQASPINYNKTAYELRHSELWLDYYKIPFDNGLPANGSIDGDSNFPFWYDAAVSIADFNGDGYEDLLHSKTGSDLVTEEYPLELFLNDQSNQNFILDNTLIPGNAKNTTARESAIGDFNNDGKPDVFYSTHGIHDGPGEIPSMLLSGVNGYTFKRFDELQPDFYHNLTSGDINNDGMLDIMLFGGGGGYNGVYTLFNNGDATFTIDNNFLVNSAENRLGGMWSTVLYDVNKDNNLDLVVAGGFDYEPFGDNNGNGTLIAILWGSGSAFDTNNSTIVSTGIYPDEFCGDVVFNDIDSDGNDEIIARFADDGNTEEVKIFKHNGNFIYTDVSDELIENNNNSTGRSIVWLRVQDIDNDGNVDIFNSDKGNSNIENVQHWEWDGSQMRRK
jgi:hypothetical protein